MKTTEELEKLLLEWVEKEESRRDTFKSIEEDYLKISKKYSKAQEKYEMARAQCYTLFYEILERKIKT